MLELGFRVRGLAFVVEGSGFASSLQSHLAVKRCGFLALFVGAARGYERRDP